MIDRTQGLGTSGRSKLTISIPKELHERVSRYRSLLKPSKVCEIALRGALMDLSFMLRQQADELDAEVDCDD